jgi:2-C-methyl-D-erythritol 4-phosphate cytidylyltransferase
MTTRGAVGIVFAGGNGNRFSTSGPPKQFERIGEKVVIDFVLEALALSQSVSRIVIGAQPEWFEFISHRLTTIAGELDIDLVTAGDTGFATRMSCLHHANHAAGAEAIGVLIDAVRPLVTSADVDRAVRVAQKCGVAIASKQPTETILYRESSGGKIHSVPRSLAYVAAAPQAAPLGECIRLHELGLMSGKDDDTIDLASLAVHSGVTPTFFETSAQNIKVTYQEDLKQVQMLLNEKMDAK